jgi:hypothetical protein
VKAMAERIIKLGVIGLGRAFTLMLPTFVAARENKPVTLNHQIGIQSR